MNKTKNRSFVALITTLLCLFMLVLSLGIFCACGNESADQNESTSATWYYGDAEPAAGLGNEGDYYLNTKTLASYVKEGKTWRVAAEGEACNWHYGTSAPQEAIGDEAGNVGDFYLNTATGDLYQKTAEGWGSSLLTLQGQKGRDGVMWFSGNGAPGTIADAIEKDFYLNKDNFDVYQLHKDASGALIWGDPIGTLKGPQGQAAKEPMHFSNGNGAPGDDNPETQNPQEGDLYLGVFDGLDDPDGEGSGSKLYRYHNGKWEVLMANMTKSRVDVHSYAQLVTLATNVQGGKDYAGVEVHLKAEIDFENTDLARSRHSAAAIAAGDWLPIGTKDHPFRGTFDGEGNIIRNFKTVVSTEATEVGFFGNIEGATIQNLHFVDVTVDATEVDSETVGVIGAVVVGQAQGAVTVKNVTVSNATVETAEGAAEENAPTVGGLVGKLESADPAKETTLKVEGSSVEGSGTADFVADKGTADVTIADSDFTDGEGNTTTWDEGGNHYAEDTEGNRSYFVGSEADLASVLKAAKAGEELNVTLEGDVVLEGSALAVSEDLTIEVGDHKLTVKSKDANVGLQVEAGKKLTITGTENGLVYLDSASNKSAISVNGEGSALNFENVKVEVNNTYDCKNDRASYKTTPAIVAENKGTVNIGSGTSITAHGQGNDMSYKEPQIAAANGDGSTIMVNGEDIVITLDNATGLYAQEGGKIDFRNGKIDMTGGSFNVALGLGRGNYGEIVFSGGEINISGNLEGQQIDPNLNNFAIAIGATTMSPENGIIAVNGGTINLKNTGGYAIAVGGIGYQAVRAFVGDGAVINLQATGEGKAYAIAGEGDGYGKGMTGKLFSDATINKGEDTNNFKLPTSSIGGGYLGKNGWMLYDGSDFMKATKMSDDRTGCDYTKKALGIVTE